jgi:glycosyltransferase involved in cell wall biosynthesis
MVKSVSFLRHGAKIAVSRAPAGSSLVQPHAVSPKVRLLCATRYGALGASSRLRLAQYLPYLQRAGLQTELRAFLSDRYITALYSGRSRVPASAAAYLRAFGAAGAARRHDMLWIEKEYLPWLPYWLERRAIGETPYILDFDDAWSLRYEKSRFWPVRALLGGKFRKLLRGAALTVTANETLYQWAVSQGAKRVLMLPTVVDLDHYVPVPPPEGVFTIGWIGTPLTAAYLRLVAEPLRQLAAEAPLKVLIIGAPDAVIDGVDCENAPWSLETEAALIGRCHAGIMPLPDDAWANGKSGYKLIQYMAMRRPAVASAIGANNQIVLDGETGLLARTALDWVTSLRALRDDPALRERLGGAARRRVEQSFCLDVTAPELIKQIRLILGNNG